MPGYRRMAWKVRRPDRTRPAWAASVSPPQAYAQSRTRDLERPYGHAEQRSNLVSASPLCHQLLNLIDSFWGKFPASPGGGAAIRHCYGSANLARQTQSKRPAEPLVSMSEIRRGAQKKPCRSGAKFGFVCRACPRGLREQARRLNANPHSRLHSAGETLARKSPARGGAGGKRPGEGTLSRTIPNGLL